jgi:type II secretory pathway pseudopilin PulG
MTIIEILIVLVTLAIVTLLAGPPLTRYGKEIVMRNRLREGMNGADTIRNAMAVYAAAHNKCYPVFENRGGDDLGVLSIQPHILSGTYFRAADYTVTSTAGTYTITATLGSWKYSINESGVENIEKPPAP